MLECAAAPLDRALSEFRRQSCPENVLTCVAIRMVHLFVRRLLVPYTRRMLVPYHLAPDITHRRDLLNAIPPNCWLYIGVISICDVGRCDGANLTQPHS